MSELEALSDEALAKRIQDGDESCLKVLTDRYYAKLRGRIERGMAPAMRRRVAASDILQEASLVALRRFADFEDRGEGSFGAWFVKIVDLKVQEAVQRHVTARKRTVEHEVTRRDRRPTGVFPAREHSPSQLLIGEELKQATRKAIEELPERHREVLRLLQDERLTTKEAAERMGLSRDAVRQLYARALARIEEMLGLGGEGSHGRRGPTR
jgi:RNA polymerase sigma-70 factor (subfamily 1)